MSKARARLRLYHENKASVYDRFVDAQDLIVNETVLGSLTIMAHGTDRPLEYIPAHMVAGVEFLYDDPAKDGEPQPETAGEGSSPSSEDQGDGVTTRPPLGPDDITVMDEGIGHS